MALTLEWRHRIMAWRHELAKHFYEVIQPVALEGGFTKDHFQLSEALKNLEFSLLLPEPPGFKVGIWLVKAAFTLSNLVEREMVALMLDTGSIICLYQW